MHPAGHISQSGSIIYQVGTYHTCGTLSQHIMASKARLPASASNTAEKKCARRSGFMYLRLFRAEGTRKCWRKALRLRLFTIRRTGTRHIPGTKLYSSHYLPRPHSNQIKMEIWKYDIITYHTYNNDAPTARATAQARPKYHGNLQI